MIKVNLRDIKRLSDDLEKVSKRALPHAARNTLNEMAFKGRGLWQEEMQKRFILRNTFTTRRVLVDKAKGTNVPGMRSVLSAGTGYLETQEHGGTVKHSVPTGVATGEGRGAAPRRRLVRKPNALAAIHLTRRPPGGSPQQRNAAAIHSAIAHGQRFVFLELQRRKGLFKLSGGRRNLKVDMVWDTTRRTHHIKPTPTLGPALQRLDAQVPKIMEAALVAQLRYNKVFGY